ncbi:MAG TPA: pilus assembly protein TadG-related protein [Acidobacteriota bacterium]|jgi:hypothetical protein|nr:pilus assembly protein TadG-related protein [Acidobacteriota bacterium]
MRNTDQRGYVLATAAITLAVLLGFAALAVDVGVLYGARADAQRAADAAALAGAFTFVLDSGASQPDLARDHAIKTAVTNSIVGAPIQESDVTVDVDVDNRVVNVRISRNQPTIFARVLGSTGVLVAAGAAAEAGTPGQGPGTPKAAGSRCAKPWFIPTTFLLPAGTNCTTACNSRVLSSKMLLQNGEPTPYALSQIGQRYTLHVMQDGVSAIQLDAAGAGEYRDNVAACADTPVLCGNTYPIEPANVTSATLQGVNLLVGNPARFQFVERNRYRDQTGIETDTTPGLIAAPIWDVCAYCPTASTTSMSVNGFALLFIEDSNGVDVDLRLISIFGCGDLALGANGETGPYSIPVRLVRLTV